MEQPLQTGKGQMTDKTAIQRIQELDRERATLFEQAKEEALRRATQAVEDLNALGLKYRLVEGEPAAGSKGVGKKPQEPAQAADKKRGARPPG
jgi:hypothetical protein